MTIPHQPGRHGGAAGHGGHGGHPGHHGPHGPGGHAASAALGLIRATGTVTSIGGSTFVLATDGGELSVTTDGDTNFHGLSRREAREAGHSEAEVEVINTFAFLKAGRRVGVVGKRQDDGSVLARGVHCPVRAGLDAG